MTQPPADHAAATVTLMPTDPRSDSRDNRRFQTTRAPTAETGVPISRATAPQNHDSTPGMAWLLLLGGILGAIAAGILTVEKIALLSNDTYVPSCSLNPVLNCGSIMRTDQAEVFGFPNPLLGIAAFPALAATGAGLLAGARYRRWYWLGLQGGVTLGAVFVGWLIFQSLYRINALCPYCMVVWAVVIPIFWAVTAHNLRHGTFGERPGRSRAARVVYGYQPVIMATTLIVVGALITERFWDYWASLVR